MTKDPTPEEKEIAGRTILWAYRQGYAEGKSKGYSMGYKQAYSRWAWAYRSSGFLILILASAAGGAVLFHATFALLWWAGGVTAP